MRARIKRLMTATSASILAVSLGMGQAYSAGLLDTQVPNVLNTYEDQNRESIIDLDGDNKLSEGDIAVGFVRLDNRTIPAGVSLGVDEIYIAFALEVDAISFESIPALGIRQYTIAITAPDAGNPLSVPSLMNLPALPGGGQVVAAVVSNIGIDLVNVDPGDIDGITGSNVLDFVAAINNAIGGSGSLDLVVGFREADDFWRFNATVPAIFDPFDNLTLLNTAPLTGGLPGLGFASFQAGLSILFSAGSQYAELAVSNETGTLHDVVVANGNLSGSADLLGGVLTGSSATIPGLPCPGAASPQCSFFGLSSNADFSLFPATDVCELNVEKTCAIVPPPPMGNLACDDKIAATLLQYIGPSKSNATVVFFEGTGSPGSDAVTYSNVDLVSGVTVLSMPSESGFSIDNRPDDLSSKMTARVNGKDEVHHTSCSTPYVAGQAAPLDSPKGDPSPNWFVLGFIDKNGVEVMLPDPPDDFPSEPLLCEFSPEPQGKDCDDIKPITELTLVWDGPDGVDILTEGGESIVNIQNGQVIMINTEGVGNDVSMWLSGSVNGDSKFHISCSDHAMNGPEDCGSNQGNGKSNDSGLNNDWLFGGMTGEKGMFGCPGIPGGADSAEVMYGISVENLNNQPVDVNIVDSLLGIARMETIAANATFKFVTDAIVTPGANDLFKNTVTVTGTTQSGATCEAMDMVTVKRNPPPPPFDCDDAKPIQELQLIWDGPSGLNLETEGGQFFNNILNGQEIMINTEGLGNDVSVWLRGSVHGDSKFHISCSDHAMNGPEDCGTNQGNGKGNDSNLNNQFLLEGMIGENGAFDCTVVSGETMRDEFNSVSYGNNDGTALWSTSWIEVDAEGVGPGSGNVQVSSGELSLDDNPDTGGQPSLEREADLGGASTAVFSFDFSTTSGVDSDDTVVVELSSNGGASYSVRETFSGANFGSRTYDISASISTETRVRFRVTNLYGGSNENFLIDNVQIVYF